MNNTDAALDKLDRIQQLWKEMGQTKADTREYETLQKKIRVLTDEYQALLDASINPKKPK